jgi:two-component system, cell cycle response regulator
MQTEAIISDKIVPFLRRTEKPLNILVVEDDRIERMFMNEQIRDLGHRMQEAENGKDALEKLLVDPNGTDIILMDRMMPVMDGLSAVRRIKENRDLRKIPIVMVTGAAGVRDIQEGIDAGVFYYLTKPVNEDVLKSVLAAASREAIQTKTLNEELVRHKTGFHLIETCKFRFRTLEEAESLPAFIAHCFPDPPRVLPGIAELVLNAVEHGTYDIGYEKKSELLEHGTWRAEIIRRQNLPEFAQNSVEAILTHKDNGTYLVITDQGNGFEWRRFMTIEPARAKDNHGRGIAQANALSFDKLTYNEQGNQAIAFVSKTQQLEW